MTDASSSSSLLVERRPLPSSDAIAWIHESAVLVNDALDDVEARWCVAVAQAHGDLHQDDNGPEPSRPRQILVRRAAAGDLISDKALRGTLRRWPHALDVAADLSVPLDCLFHRLRWLTAEERFGIGAPMPTGWPPRTMWRFYRVELAPAVSLRLFCSSLRAA